MTAYTWKYNAFLHNVSYQILKVEIKKLQKILLKIFYPLSFASSKFSCALSRGTISLYVTSITTYNICTY